MKILAASWVDVLTMEADMDDRPDGTNHINNRPTLTTDLPSLIRKVCQEVCDEMNDLLEPRQRRMKVEDLRVRKVEEPKINEASPTSFIISAKRNLNPSFAEGDIVAHMNVWELEA